MKYGPAFAEGGFTQQTVKPLQAQPPPEPRRFAHGTRQDTQGAAANPPHDSLRTNSRRKFRHLLRPRRAHAQQNEIHRADARENIPILRVAQITREDLGHPAMR